MLRCYMIPYMNEERQKRLKSALRENLLRRKTDGKDGLHRPSKGSIFNDNPPKKTPKQS